MYSHILRYVLIGLLAFLGLATGCVQEEKPVVPTEKQDMITLYFKDATKPATRALTPEQESEVKTIDVLAFKLTYSQLQYAYHVPVNELDIKEVNSTTKQFAIKVPDDSEKYQYVLLANARAEVEQYLNAGNRLYELKDVFLPKIIMENKDLWKAKDDFKRIPMWGESDGAKTVKELDKNEIALYRSLAKVNIKVGTNKFELKEVYVYNRPSRGRIAPDMSHWNSTDKRFTSPTLPDNLGIVDMVAMNQNKYTVPTGATEFLNEIYLFETKELGTHDFIDATCLVLGGEYNGSMNYYRVDFAKVSSSTGGSSTPPFDWGAGPPATGEGEGGMVGAGDNYHPLLRNHHYELNITGVTGKGFAQPDSAVKSINSQLVTEFLTWNDTNQDIVIDNNSYTLTIVPHEVTISQVNSMGITLSTNYPTPTWKLTEPSESWFKCVLAGNIITVSYTNPATPPPSGSTGYFRVRLMDGNKQKVSQQIKVTYQ